MPDWKRRRVPLHGGSGLGWDLQGQSSAAQAPARRGASSLDLPDAARCSQMQGWDSGRPFSCSIQTVLKAVFEAGVLLRGTLS